MIRLVVAIILMAGTAQAAEKKSSEILVIDEGKSLVTNARTGQAVYTGSQSGGSLVITDPRTMKTVAVIPKEKK